MSLFACVVNPVAHNTVLMYACMFVYMPAFYRGAHGVVLVYDTSDHKKEESFHSESPARLCCFAWGTCVMTTTTTWYTPDVHYWMDSIRTNASSSVETLLVGNKVDRPLPRVTPLTHACRHSSMPPSQSLLCSLSFVLCTHTRLRHHEARPWQQSLASPSLKQAPRMGRM